MIFCHPDVTGPSDHRPAADPGMSRHCPGELPLNKRLHSITYFVAQAGWATSSMLTTQY